MIRIAAPTVLIGLPAAPEATGLLGRIALWRRLRAERRALSRLDARMLKDIGIDRSAAAEEAARPFWSEPVDRT